MKGYANPSGTKKVTLCCTNSSRGLQPHPHPFPFQFPDQTFGLCILLTEMKAARLLVIGGLMLLSVICGPGEASAQQDQQLQFSFFNSFGGGFISSGSVPAVGLALHAASCKPGRPAGIHPQLRSKRLRGILTIHLFYIIFTLDIL